VVRLRRIAGRRPDAAVFLGNQRTRKRAALDRLLAVVPTLESAGVAPMSVDEIDEEVNAARAERRAREQAPTRSKPDDGTDGR
jgi:hypothetical protein